jgi:hypothetical protein
LLGWGLFRIARRRWPAPRAQAQPEAAPAFG